MNEILRAIRPRLWAALRNWTSGGAPDLVVTPSEQSERRVNLIAGERLVASVDVVDLIEAIRQVQHVRRTGKVPTALVNDTTVRIRMEVP